MISEIDLLKNDIPRLEKTLGSRNLFVEVLKADLAALQRKQKPRRPRLHSHRRFYKSERASNPEKQ